MRSSGASCLHRGLLALGCCAALALAGRAAASTPDPLLPVTLRIGNYLAHHETYGATLDSRYPINPSEVIRLSVVSQLLAYNDLCATLQGYVYRQDVSDRATYLVSHFREITSGTAFDGMLGYALLGAYGLTGDTLYLRAALPIVDVCMRLSGSQNRLNWGLMSAMALARYYNLTGDPAALKKTREILDSVVADQFPNGIFAHYCNQSADLHYTAWMGMELIHVQRYVDYPAIEQVLGRIDGFLRQQVGPDGRTAYEAPCPGVPGCWIYYDSRRTGCPQDYDTRGWINELGYNAMVFDHFHDARYYDVMRFLDSLEVGGTVADKWGYLPPVKDPIYPWASADTSVIRASVVFWSLASICNSRYAGWVARYIPPRGPLVGKTLGTLMAELSTWSGPDPAGGQDFAAILAENRTASMRYQWTTVDSLVLAEGTPVGPHGGGLPGVGPIGGPRHIPEGDRAADDGTGMPGAQARPAALARLGPLAADAASPVQSVRFSLSRDADVALVVYDAHGRVVRELLSGHLGAGEYRAAWDRQDSAGRACPSGIYFVRLRAGDEAHSGKILIMR